MPDVKVIFAVLGPLFLLLAAWRCISSKRLVPQARAWLIIGVVFSAVAAWLWWGVPAQKAGENAAVVALRV